MKTRIAKRIWPNDSISYIIQEKKWFGWGIMDGHYTSQISLYRSIEYKTHHTFEEAESALKKQVSLNKRLQQKITCVKHYETL